MKHKKKTKVQLKFKVKEMQWVAGVRYVALMQRKLDFYERFITDIHMMILRGKPMPIPKMADSSWETADIYNFVSSKLSEQCEKSSSEGLTSLATKAGFTAT